MIQYKGKWVLIKGRHKQLFYFGKVIYLEGDLFVFIEAPEFFLNS